MHTDGARMALRHSLFFHSWIIYRYFSHISLRRKVSETLAMEYQPWHTIDTMPRLSLGGGFAYHESVTPPPPRCVFHILFIYLLHHATFLQLPTNYTENNQTDIDTIPYLTTKRRQPCAPTRKQRLTTRLYARNCHAQHR